MTKVIVGLRAAVTLAAAAGLVFLFSSAATGAETTLVTIDSSAPSLEERDGGGWTASLGFTNLTDDFVALTAQPDDAEDTGCRLTLDAADLPAAEHSDVIVTIPAACDVGEDFSFIVSAESESPPADTTSPIPFEVTAAKPDTSKPDWNALWAFPIAFGGVLLVAVLYCGYLAADERKTTAPFTKLKFLDAAWSFNDSWVSNITVLAGLLTGIFGSTDVVTAFTGEDAKSAVALAVVGAAVAAAFIAAGPIVLLATKSKPERKPESSNDGFFTVGGLLLASVFTLAGAAGELWVVYRSGQQLDLGGWEDDILWFAIAGFVLLAIYAGRAIPATIKVGTTDPGPSDPSETMKAAALIVEALKARPDFNGELFKAQAGQLAQDLSKITSGQPARAPRRSALL